MIFRRVFCLGAVAQCLALSPHQQVLTPSSSGGMEDFLLTMAINAGGTGAIGGIDDPVVVEAKQGSGKGLFGSGLLTNLMNDGKKEIHTPVPNGLSKEDQAWWRRMFWYGMFAFFIISGLVVVIGTIMIMTCGRSYFFASSARTRMEEDLKAKMPADIKEYVRSAEFDAKCDRVFAEHDPNRTGSVVWTKELKQGLLAEYGEEIKDHKYFKELEDAKWAAVDKGVSMNRAAYGEVLRWMEFIRQDAATGGIEPTMVTTIKPQNKADEEKPTEKGEEKPLPGVKAPRKEAV